MNISQPGLVMNPSAGGPVGAHPGAQLQEFAQMQSSAGGIDTVLHLNTYIYDYFLRKENYDLARAFLKTYTCKTTPRPKQNGAMDLDKKDRRPDDLPDPDIPGVAPEDPAFLESWWQCFWDMFFVARNQKTTSMNQLHQQYLMQQRLRQNTGNGTMLAGGRAIGQYNNMVNGVMAKTLQNRNVTPQGLANMQGKMIGQQMQRDPSTMEMNGQRPQTPGDNAPSPSKRPRIDNGAFDGQGMMNRVAGMQQGGNVGANGSQPMMQNGQMAGFAPGTGAPLKMETMNGMPQAAIGGQSMEGGDNRHALQDYQMQLMLLEQQNKKRLMQANRDRDTIAVAANNAGTPGGGFAAPNMSPSGSRGAGPSPTPGEQMKRIGGTPKMPQQTIPGSPMPDMQNRASPAPSFDPNTAQMQPGGMPQQYYANIGGNPLARPQTSHPNFPMTITGMNQPTMEQMHRLAANNGRMPNGQPWPQSANPAMQANQQNPTMRNAQQNPGAMGPPPAPAGEPQAGSQRTQPSSPAQPTAPQTPSQSSKSAPKGKKEAGQKKKTAAKKGSNTGATPAADSSEQPNSTPPTPITPMHSSSFSKPSGTQQTATANATSAVASAPQPPMDPNPTAPGGFPGLVDDANGYSLEFAGVDTNDVLENFDFDSFLHTDDVNNIGMDFAFDSNVADASV